MTQEGDQRAAAVVAAIVKIQDTWCFAGALSTTIPHVQDSYHADLCGGFLRSKFAYDLLKVHEVVGHSLPDVWFAFDSITVGKQAAGEWHCFADDTSGACVRHCQR